MKPRNWGLIATISTLFLALLAIPAISNSDKSDIIAGDGAPPTSSSQSPTQSPSNSVDPTQKPKSSPSAVTPSTSSSPNPDPKSDKDEALEIPKEFLKSLLGMKEEDAKELIWDNNYLSRVVHRDGEDFMVTADYRYNRINLYINGGIVFDATVG